MYNQAGNPTLANLTFSSNSAGWGGGMYNDSSSPSLTNITFNGNFAANNGGGMDNENNSSPTLLNVIFNQNDSHWGGGMFFSGGYEVAFSGTKHGGKNFIQAAKVTFDVDVSIG